jgi:hypothetical protein
LVNLRQDFYWLALLFIKGNYGEFDSKMVGTIPKSAKTPNLPQEILKNLLRFTGAILPIVIFSLYLWRPNLIPFVVVDKNVVSFILIAWLMLSIDAFLKLGIVSGMTALLKSIKELA